MVGVPTLTAYHRAALRLLEEAGRPVPEGDLQDCGLGEELEELIRAGLVRRKASEMGRTRIRYVRPA